MNRFSVNASNIPLKLQDVFVKIRPVLTANPDSYSLAKNNTDYNAKARPKQHLLAYYKMSQGCKTLELLAVGGFYGNDATCSQHSFLGSAISEMPPEMRQDNSSTSILTRDWPCQYCVSYRHNQQYIKDSALKNWSFHSRRFLDKGFFSVNIRR